VAAAGEAGIDRKDPLRPVIEALATMPGFVISGVGDLLATTAEQAYRAEKAQLERLAGRARWDRWCLGMVSFAAGLAGMAAGRFLL
jgi:hypothetical protein